jgi:late competence protein required for DNA uptake (superfamily II DNA/RNA helicase)
MTHNLSMHPPDWQKMKTLEVSRGDEDVKHQKLLSCACEIIISTTILEKHVPLTNLRVHILRLLENPQ